MNYLHAALIALIWLIMDPYKGLSDSGTYLGVIPGDIRRLIANYLRATYKFSCSLVYDGTWQRDIDMGLPCDRRLVSGHGGLHVIDTAGKSTIVGEMLRICGKFANERGRWVSFQHAKVGRTPSGARGCIIDKKVYNWLGDPLYEVSIDAVNKNAVLAQQIPITPHVAGYISGQDIDQTYAFSGGCKVHSIHPIIYEHTTGKLVTRVHAVVSGDAIFRFGEWFAFGDYDTPRYRVTLVDMQGCGVFTYSIPNHNNRACRMIVASGGIFVLVGDTTIYLVEITGVKEYQ